MLRVDYLSSKQEVKIMARKHYKPEEIIQHLSTVECEKIINKGTKNKGSKRG